MCMKPPEKAIIHWKTGGGDFSDFTISSHDNWNPFIENDQSRSVNKKVDHPTSSTTTEGLGTASTSSNVEQHLTGLLSIKAFQISLNSSSRDLPSLSFDGRPMTLLRCKYRPTKTSGSTRCFCITMSLTSLCWSYRVAQYPYILKLLGLPYRQHYPN